MHARRTERDVILGRREIWFEPVSDSDRTERYEKYALETVQSILNATEKTFRGYGRELPNYIRQYLTDWLLEVTRIMEVHIERLMTRTNELPRDLWVGSADTWSRLLGYAVRKAGGHVTGHDHATGSGHRKRFPKSVGDFVSCDRFVTFNESQAEAQIASLDLSLLFQDEPPEIKAVPRSRGSRSSKHHTSRSAGHPSTVMVVTAFYREERKTIHPSMSDPVAVDWQARLFDRLLGWDYRVLHKHHPSSVPPPDAFRQDFGVIPIEGAFEDTMDKADVVLIADDAGTTVFRSVLATDKPVVLVDHGLFGWSEQARELLIRRCALVEGFPGADNRAHVDWQELKDAIPRSLELRDPSFYDTYFAIT